MSTLPNIFISYRRGDSAAYAGRLYDALVQRFGESQVFTDIYDISAGEDFERILLNSLSGTTVMIVVIGPKWRGPRGWFRRSRIWNEGDWIRRELEVARSVSVSMVPILVGGASLPEPAELPESLRFLNRIQAFSLRDDRWADDVSALVRVLESAHAKRATPPEQPPAPPTTTPQNRPWITRWHVVGAGGVITVALIALTLILFVNWDGSSLQQPNVNSTGNGNLVQSTESPASLNANVMHPSPQQSNSNTAPPPEVAAKVGLVKKSPATDQSIDIGFMNLRWFTEQVDELRVQNVATALVNLNLDAIGLTEVEKASVDRLVAKLTERGIPVNYVYEDAPGQQDLALVFRRDRLQCAREDDIYTSHQAKLNELEPATGKPVFPRPPLFALCSSARFKAPINVVVVHFKAMSDETSQRRRQLASVILGEIISRSQRRTVVGGDFNCKPSEALQAFNGLTNVGGLNPLFDANDTAVSYIGNPAFQILIDHIWASPGLTIVPVENATSVVVAIDEMIPDYVHQVSDHRPIVARFAYEQ